MSEHKVTTLDVRDVIAAGREPFSLIMNAVNALEQPGDEMLLIAPFEPTPLYRVLKEFDHETSVQADGSYMVRFTRR